MKYPVILHKSKYGYAVFCPALPGCCSQGDTREDALENIKDAIKTYLETVKALNKRKLSKNGKNKNTRYTEVAV